MIFWFSGTGNSALTAQRLGERLGEPLTRIGAGTPAKYALGEDERVVWVFPVYSWGVPPVVRRFMRSVDIGDNRGLHSMVCTCGDDCGLTFDQWSGEVRGRGWRRGGGYSVEMPNTYVSLPGFDVDPAATMRRKLDEAPARIDAIARAISVDARVEDMVKGSMAALKTRVIYPVFTRLLMSPRPFRSTDACVSCGKCAAACPMDNIAMADGRPHWADNCAGCLACYHACPQHAVAYGHRTGGKGQYRAPRELPDE